MAEYIKICPVCGKTFKAICDRKKYCSLECRRATNKNPFVDTKRKCRTCGVHLTDGRHNWCDKCMMEYYQKTKSRGAYNSLIKRGYGLKFIMEDLERKKTPK